MNNRLLLVLLCLMAIVRSYCQSLPVNFTSLHDYIRRAQLLGEFDSTYSMTIFPVRFETESVLPSGKYKLSKKLIDLDNNISLGILPIEWRSQFNSHHPKLIPNRGMVPGRGYQTLLSFGASFELGPLKGYIKPDFYYSQNKSYEGFPDTIANHIWEKRYLWWNTIDTPESFGEKAKTKFLHGQSKISIDIKNVSFGVARESLWWGPGRYHSLIMTDNALPFLHASFNSITPLKTPVGHFQWQVISGRLEGSGYSPPFPERFNNNTFFFKRDDDWRYLSAFSLSYSPKWLSGLFLGFNRAIQQYWSLAQENRDYFPVFINFFRKNDNPNRSESQIDQILSFTFRYFSKESNGEFYFEYGRNDASLNLRDFIMSPQHTAAYVVGFTKYFPLKNNTNLEINAELIELQRGVNNEVRPTLSWYIHSRVRHGYTNRGKVLGAAIGPGSNSQIVEINWTNGIKKIGVQFERLVHNNDFFISAYGPSNDWRRYWVDLSPGANFSWDFKNLLLQSRVYITRSLNYQWELHNNPGNSPYFVEGRDVTNLYFSVNVAYFFDDLNFDKK